jgi:ABC-type nitrate/sulfonate/bicarbonate transport system substrate-binding protein
MSASDVTFVIVGNIPNQVVALQAGRVAATPLTVPEHFAAEQYGAHPLVNFAEIYQAPLSGICGSKARLAAQPSQAVRLLRAIRRGVQFAQTNQDESVRLIAEFTSIDAPQASAAYDLVKDTWNLSGVVNDETIRNSLMDPEKAATVDLATLVDWSFARQAGGGQ